jgi:rifampin ADP-ribosylating transferase
VVAAADSIVAAIPGAIQKRMPAPITSGSPRVRGNPTRSYRSSAPLRVVGEVTEWTRQAPERLQAWKERLAALRADERGEIIN